MQNKLYTSALNSETFGELDILVNNAGTAIPNRLIGMKMAARGTHSSVCLGSLRACSFTETDLLACALQ